jgi:general stress protein CsbA
MKHIDKVYHFFAGMVIYIFFNIFFNTWISIIPVIVIGAAKEFYDWYTKKGNPEWMDFIWTVIGGLVVLLLSL